MLYMKSTSGADGSYTLTVTFALGTDPDINTVNVQNRVSLAEPQLPEEVTRQGLTTKKKSSALLQVIQLLLAGRHLRRPVPGQLRDDQPDRPASSGSAASATPPCSARSTTACGSGSIPTG